MLKSVTCGSLFSIARKQKVSSVYKTVVILKTVYTDRMVYIYIKPEYYSISYRPRGVGYSRKNFSNCSFTSLAVLKLEDFRAAYLLGLAIRKHFFLLFGRQVGHLTCIHVNSKLHYNVFLTCIKLPLFEFKSRFYVIFYCFHCLLPIYNGSFTLFGAVQCILSRIITIYPCFVFARSFQTMTA